MNLAELSHIRFRYDDAPALDDVSLTIAEGEYVALTGPNGSGKSTLSRLVAGLVAPDSGTITLLGRTVFSPAGPDADAYRAARRGIGAVFQNPEDQLVTTVLEDDVAFGPENLGIPRDAADGGDGRDDMTTRIADALGAVRLDGMRGANPIRMSGGQQQRAAIAGMLAMRPRLLVLDEPTAMLDPLARAEVMDVLDELHAAGTTIVHVTHHPDEIARAGRVVRLEGGRVVGDSVASSDSTSGSSGVRSATAGLRRPTRSRPLGQAYGRATQTGLRSLGTSGTLATSGVLETHETSQPGIAPVAGRPATTFMRRESREGAGASGSSDVMLSVEHVSYAYAGGDGPILDDVSLQVRRGETVALMGANGSGKSTLLRLVCALDKPDSGSITIDGLRVDTAKRRDLARLRRTVGLVMQHPERQLFADTVRDDVAYGPTNQGLDRAEINARVDAALRLARLDGLADRSPFDLSGGQQRLAAIAGVVACRPALLVMDEPTAGLDADARERVYALLDDLRAQGVSVLIVTHSHEEAHRVADRVLDMGLLSAGGGNGTPVVAADDAGRGVSHPVPPDVAARVPQGHGPMIPAVRSTAESTESEGAKRRGKPAATEASRRVHSPVARLDPRVKMVAILVAMFSAFAISNPWQLLLGAVFTGGVIAASRVRLTRLLGSVRMFLGLFAVMGLLNVFFVRTGHVLVELGPVPITDDGVVTAILYTCRFALVIVLGAVFLATTTPTAITDAFASLLSPLNRLGVHTQEIALVLSLALRFIPTLAVEAQAVADAQAARGGSIETGSLPQRVKAMTAIIVPIFAGALRHADNLSLALDARCYEEGIRRTHWRVMRVVGRDVAFAVIVAIYVAALLTLGLFV
ncbi:energy-coupling factor transporter ATPase [Bifidobacterium santillanense]|uniref:energy-coupling factor transporter ATPase n=1 Tax=Bifidobacterium santillanense TaxID=2809028 RepID=UPI0030B82438